ncbi:MAG: hypothetical protein ACFB10_06200 [Salibacteraceae bacterium]
MQWKKLLSLLAFTFLIGVTLIYGQTDDLPSFNQDRLSRQKTAMAILGTWAIGNMAVGAVGMGRSSGETRYFHQMNVGWNVVNLSIAGWAFYQAAKADPFALDAAATFQEHHNLQKLLLFNAGLDVGYMLGGAYLMERSRRGTSNAPRLKGFGRSIAVQGAFLFLFDVSTYAVFATQNDRLFPLLGPNGIGMGFKF